MVRDGHQSRTYMHFVASVCKYCEFTYVLPASLYLPESPGICLKLASRVKQDQYCSTGAGDMKKPNA